MAIFYLPKEDFSLKRNPGILVFLREAKISEKNYNENIEPFFNSLSGFYFTNAHQLKRMFIPKLKFGIRNASLSKIFNYVSNKSNQVEIPIQDFNSLKVETGKSLDYNPDYEYLVKRGLLVQTYDKQTGLLIFSRDNEIERKNITLEDITTHQILVGTATLSDEAIDNILR